MTSVMAAATAPTAATMRLDGGHPALELVNTIYAVVGGPVDFDVLSTPDDLVTFAARIGVGAALPDDTALRAARALRAALDPLLRAHLVATDAHMARRDEAVRAAVTARDPASSRAPGRVATSWGAAEVAPAARAFEAARLTAQRSARLEPGYAWAWDDADPLAPVHRLAHAADRLLTGPDLALLRCCDACCWLYLDRAGKGRKWCSMADCGTEAKKRRYVEKRRRLRAR
jgi:predicted RNA-binding Zn ribbon-like protein